MGNRHIRVSDEGQLFPPYSRDLKAICPDRLQGEAVDNSAVWGRSPAIHPGKAASGSCAMNIRRERVVKVGV